MKIYKSIQNFKRGFLQKFANYMIEQYINEPNDRTASELLKFCVALEFWVYFVFGVELE